MRFYKATPADVVVFHDEIDLAPGCFRMKTGGALPVAIGIRSVTEVIGADFAARGLGIGHPGHKDLVMATRCRVSPAKRNRMGRPASGCLRRRRRSAAAGEDEKYQGKVLMLAPRRRLIPRKARTEGDGTADWTGAR